MSGPTIFYSYSVGGVTYSASQDVSQLEEHLPRDFHRLIGAPTSLKYFHQNPANSIILCEEWSGLRATSSEKLGSGELDFADVAVVMDTARGAGIDRVGLLTAGLTKKRQTRLE